MDNIPIFNQNGIKAKVGSSKAGTYSPSISYTVDDIVNGGVAWQNIDLITFLKSGKPTVELVETLGSVLYVGTYKINEIIALLKSGVNGQFLGANLGNPEWQNFPVATQTEYFNKNNTKAITANNVYNDVSKAQFHILNTITGLTQAVAPSGSYNILTAMLESAETQVGNIPVIFKTVGNITQDKLLNQTTDVIILPSPLYTYNVTYTKYNVFVSCVLDIPVIPNNKVIELYIVIRRVDNSQVVRSAPFTYTPTNELAGTRLDVECSSGLMPIFVNGESDVLCNTGFRVFIESAAYSNVNITLKSSSIIIFRN